MVKDLDRGRKCLNRLYGSDTPLPVPPPVSPPAHSVLMVALVTPPCTCWGHATNATIKTLMSMTLAYYTAILFSCCYIQSKLTRLVSFHRNLPLPKHIKETSLFRTNPRLQVPVGKGSPPGNAHSKSCLMPIEFYRREH